MFNTLKRLYETGQLDNEALRNAVIMEPLPWITEEDYKEITGEAYQGV